MSKSKQYNVGSGTNTKNLADSIYQFYLNLPDDNDGPANICLKAVGAGALNQAIKSIIIANKSLAAIGFTLSVKPFFENIDPGTNFTGIGLNLVIVEI